GRVVQADERGAVLDREVHDFADLVGVRLRQRTAEDREVLGEDVDRTARNRAGPADDAVAGDRDLVHAEVAAPVHHERIELQERARVEQQVDALVRGELALGVLPRDALGSAALETLLPQGLEVGDPLLEGHEGFWLETRKLLTERSPSARPACAGSAGTARARPRVPRRSPGEPRPSCGGPPRR